MRMKMTEKPSYVSLLQAITVGIGVLTPGTDLRFVAGREQAPLVGVKSRIYAC